MRQQQTKNGGSDEGFGDHMSRLKPATCRGPALRETTNRMLPIYYSSILSVLCGPGTETGSSPGDGRSPLMTTHPSGRKAASLMGSNGGRLERQGRRAGAAAHVQLAR